MHSRCYHDGRFSHAALLATGYRYLPERNAHHRSTELPSLVVYAFARVFKLDARCRLLLASGRGRGRRALVLVRLLVFALSLGLESVLMIKWWSVVKVLHR